MWVGQARYGWRNLRHRNAKQDKEACCEGTSKQGLSIEFAADFLSDGRVHTMSMSTGIKAISHLVGIGVCPQVFSLYPLIVRQTVQLHVGFLFFEIRLRRWVSMCSLVLYRSWAQFFLLQNASFCRVCLRYGINSIMKTTSPLLGRQSQRTSLGGFRWLCRYAILCCVR